MTQGKSLIVGASGQVGWQLLAVLGLDRAIPSSRQGIAGDWISVDLAALADDPRQAEGLVHAHEIDAIYCVGGMTDVERCEGNSELAMRINCWGPAALAAAAAHDGRPFIYFSTEYVFNGNNGPYSEDMPGDPTCVYGESKWRGEIEVAKAHPRALIIRTTVVYGPDPRRKNFVHTLRRELQEGRLFRVPTDQISTPTYSRDLADAVVALVNKGTTGVFHICGPERLSRKEFAVRAAIAMGMDAANIKGVPTSELGQKARRPLDAGLAIDKLRRVLPEVRMRGIEESICDWVSNAGAQAL